MRFGAQIALPRHSMNPLSSSEKPCLTMMLFCFISYHTYSLIPKSRIQKGRTHLWAYGIYDVRWYPHSAQSNSKQIKITQKEY